MRIHIHIKLNTIQIDYYYFLVEIQMHSICQWDENTTLSSMKLIACTRSQPVMVYTIENIVALLKLEH